MPWIHPCFPVNGAIVAASPQVGPIASVELLFVSRSPSAERHKARHAQYFDILLKPN
jgi:hypothetical protein